MTGPERIIESAKAIPQTIHHFSDRLRENIPNSFNWIKNHKIESISYGFLFLALGDFCYGSYFDIKNYPHLGTTTDL